MLKRGLVIAVAIVGILAVGALGEDVYDIAQRILPEECVTQTDLFLVLNQVFGDCVEIYGATAADVVAAFVREGFLPQDFVFDPEACVSKGFVSQILYRGLPLTAGVLESVRIFAFGLSPDMATKIAQRHCVMVRGTAEELLNGREFVACILAWIQFEIDNRHVACDSYYIMKKYLDRWSDRIQRTVMTEAQAAVYIPCLIVVPTS